MNIPTSWIVTLMHFIKLLLLAYQPGRLMCEQNTLNNWQQTGTVEHWTMIGLNDGENPDFFYILFQFRSQCFGYIRNASFFFICNNLHTHCTDCNLVCPQSIAPVMYKYLGYGKLYLLLNIYCQVNKPEQSLTEKPSIAHVVPRRIEHTAVRDLLIKSQSSWPLDQEACYVKLSLSI